MPDLPSRNVELVETFERNIDTYKQQPYNEAQVRSEFIDPFFEELGWDITNKGGLAQAYKDVIHEDAIKIGGYTKAPDYCFRIGGTRKFFLEAKKPSIDIKGDPHPAYQLRRYAWSAKLPLSIVTDFEEFAVYDCQIVPKQTDRASTARIQYFNYKDYIKKWDEIAKVFSKDAILKGSFDKFAAETKGKRGTTTVDKEFLAELEKWRRELARIIALRNRDLSIQQINFAVQRTIDRIIFLRMCEDRGIEHYGQLLGLSTGRETYQRLCQVFRQADAKYNSGLFHFRPEKGRPEPDELTPNITIDDTPLKWILHSLYYPQSPYEFSVLPAEILGNVYEQFLGKVIRLTPAHFAKIEEKPEVKKAGGIYYTPAYIVDYIVKNTVGRLLGDHDRHCEACKAGRGNLKIDNGKSKIENHKLLTPAQISDLRILDPACGSGSFLLGAYTYLLDYHRDWYVENNPSKHKDKIYQGKGGQWFLTIAEKKRILLSNIFGVDIDSQAVEVTKLSLLLKVLEGETSETIGQTYRMFHERALPDLADNIKCGNSLIGPDFFDNLDVIPPHQPFSRRRHGDVTPHHGDEDSLDQLRKKINAFDWQAEFPQIFSGKNPGFHAIIGNPPWGAKILKSERKHLSYLHPEVADFESSQYFVSTCSQLLQPSGLLGMILPNTFALNVFAQRFREKILTSAFVYQIVDLSQISVFAGPKVRSMILMLSKAKQDECFIYASHEEFSTFSCLRSVSQKQLRQSQTWKSLFTVETSLSKLIYGILSRCDVLDDYCQVRQGYIPYRTSTLTKRFGAPRAQQIVKNRTWHSTRPESSEYQKELQGKDVTRYALNWSGVWVRYGEWVSTYLPMSVFSGSRVLIREITQSLPHSLLATHTEETFVHNPSVLAVLPLQDSVSPKFLLGILNSRLISQVFTHVAPKARKGLFPKIIITDAKRLPFPHVNLSNPQQRARHDKLVALVERMLDLHKKLTAAKVPAEKARIQRQINNTDKKIDKLVYDLYGLTDQEITIVEESNPRG